MCFWQYLLLFLINICPPTAQTFEKRPVSSLAGDISQLIFQQLNCQSKCTRPGVKTPFSVAQLWAVLRWVWPRRGTNNKQIVFFDLSVLVFLYWCQAESRTTASFKLKGDKLRLVLMCQEMQIRTWWGMLKKWGRRSWRWGVYLKKLKQRVGWGSKEEAKKKSS